MGEYPKMIEPSIYQYDENLYVWFDETGALGGVSCYLSDMKNQMKQYADSLEGKGKIHVNMIFEVDEFNKFLEPGGMSLHEMNGDDLRAIISNMSEGVKQSLLDTPHYVWEDYIEER